MKKGREAPVSKFWYGKGAKYSSIEELIDKNPSWFIWAVESFQDVTPSQAQYFKDRYGMELPPEVISPPSISPYTHTKNSPPDEYQKLCEEYEKSLQLQKNR